MEENLRILKPFFRGLPIIVLIMILSVMAAKKYLNYITPLYQSTAILKLADINEGIPGSNLFKDLDVFATSNKIAAEIEVIKSDLLINKALDSLPMFCTIVRRVGKIKSNELYKQTPILVRDNFNSSYYRDKIFTLYVANDSAFTVIVPGNNVPINGTFNTTIELKDGNSITITLNNEFLKSKPDAALSDHYEIEFLSRSKAISQIAKNLKVTPVDKDVAILHISLKSNVGEKSSDFVNMLSKAYISDYVESKYMAAGITINFLDKQIEEIAKQLSKSESVIENYRNSKNIINIQQETETELRKISQLRIQQTNEKMNLIALEQIAADLKSGEKELFDVLPNLQTFSDLISTQFITTVKELQSERAKLLQIYTTEDERVKNLDLKVVDLSDYLIESILNAKKTVQIKYNELSNSIIEAEKIFIGVPEKERLLKIYNREFELIQQSYNFLNEKRIEANIAQAARITFHRVISPAPMPKSPVSPNSTIIVIVSAILGMMGSIVLIYLVHMMKAKVNDVVTIERNSTIPIVLETPRLKTANAIAAKFLDQVIRLELKGMAAQKSVMTISSFTNNEGRDFHAFNLAKAFAKQGKRVLLIDLNGVDWNNIEDFTIINAAEIVSTLITADKIRNLIVLYEHEYDLILLNNEPIDSGSRSMLFMNCATVNLFVVDARVTPAKRIMTLELLKNELSVSNIGFVINRLGYNPGVIGETIKQTKKATKYIVEILNKRI